MCLSGSDERMRCDMESSRSLWFSVGFCSGVMMWPLALFVAWATSGRSKPMRLPPAPLSDEKLKRARDATRTAGFNAGQGPTDAEWVNGLGLPSGSDGPGGPCNAWGTACTASRGATATPETPTQAAQDCCNCTPAGGEESSTPSDHVETLVLVFGFGAPMAGRTGASKNPECPYKPGSQRCLNSEFPEGENLCEDCPWWDGLCADLEDV